MNQYTDVMIDEVLVGLSYDDNGNLTSDGTWTYTYDVENRLINATDGSTDVDYVYDPLGRRVKKSGTGVTTTYYLSDGTEEILELNSSGNIQNRYIFGPGVDEPILMYDGSGVANGRKHYYRADPQGSIIALTERDGTVEDTYTYDAYGNPDQAGGNAIRYTGRRWDPETGLYYYRARMYNPAIGRFLQTDPVGYADNTNLYGYVGNDPVNGVDPTGLECVPVDTGPDGNRTVKCDTVQEAGAQVVTDPENQGKFVATLNEQLSAAGNKTSNAIRNNNLNVGNANKGVDQGSFITEETKTTNVKSGPLGTTFDKETVFKGSTTNENPPDGLNPDAGLFGGSSPNSSVPDNLVATAVSTAKITSGNPAVIGRNDMLRVTGKVSDNGSEGNPSLPGLANFTGKPVVVLTQESGFVVIFPKGK